MVTFRVIQHPSNKTVPIIAHLIAPTTSHFPKCLSFSLSIMTRQKKNPACGVPEKTERPPTSPVKQNLSITAPKR